MEKEKNKLKFSALDAAIIVVVLVLIATVVFRFTSDSALFAVNTDTYTVTLEISSVRSELFDTLKTGEAVYLEDGTLLGTLTTTSVTPALYYATTSKGEMITLYYPADTLVDITLTLECELAVREGMAVTGGGDHIGTGVELKLHTATTDLGAVVVSLDKLEISE